MELLPNLETWFLLLRSSSSYSATFSSWWIHSKGCCFYCPLRMWKIWAFKSSTFLAENTTGWCFAGNKGEKTYIYSSALRESLLDPPITSGWILYFWMLLLDLQSPILTDLQESRYFYLSIFAVALFIFVLVQSLEKNLFAFGMRVWHPNTKPQVLGCRGGIYNKTTTLKACKKVAETNHLSWGGDGDGCIWPWDFFDTHHQKKTRVNNEKATLLVFWYWRSKFHFQMTLKRINLVKL